MTAILNEPQHQRRRVYTTGQVAKCLRVAPRTVSKWIDKGVLEGYRLPESQDRRIPRECLIRFMIKNNFPLSYLGPDITRVLLVGTEPTIIDQIESQISKEEIIFEYDEDTINATITAIELVPNLIIIDDMGAGREAAVHFATVMKEQIKPSAIMGIFSEDAGEDFITRHRTSGTYSHIYQRPINVKQIVDDIVKLQLDA